MNASRADVSPEGAVMPTAVVRERRVELDWLRTLVVLGIVPLHALMIFAVTTTIFVKSTVSSPELGFLGDFINAWGIPVIFLVSGAASTFALAHRSAGGYARERLARLAVPLLLIMFVLAPLQAYFILLSNPSLISMSAQFGLAVPGASVEQMRDFTVFYQQYVSYLFTSVHQFSRSINNLIFGQLWFVPRLLAVSFICLPLFLYLRGPGKRWVERVASVGSHPLALLLGAGILPAILVALLRPGWLERVTAGWIYTDEWPNFFIDLAMFVYGYLIYANPRLRAAVRDLWIPASILGSGVTVLVVALMAMGRVPPADYSLASILYAFATAFAAWLPALALLAVAMRFLTRSTPALRYLTPAAFPVYVLHTSILAVSAYYLLMLPVPWYVQLALILAVTLAGSLALYEYVLRRARLTRFLFGIPEPRGEKRPPAHPSPASHPDGAQRTALGG